MVREGAQVTELLAETAALFDRLAKLPPGLYDLDGVPHS